MKCQNCGEKESNFKYTQIINGVKKQMNLCTECARELGLDDINLNIPINFSNFLSDMFDVYSDNDLFLLNDFKNEINCPNCKMTYDEFLNDGKFGCEDCYDTFKNQIDILLKNIHGANHHVGRIGKHVLSDKNKINKIDNIKNNLINKDTKNIDDKKNETNKEKENKTKLKKQIEELEERLKLEIKEERYEDAAKTRDEIKLLKKEN